MKSVLLVIGLGLGMSAVGVSEELISPKFGCEQTRVGCPPIDSVLGNPFHNLLVDKLPQVKDEELFFGTKFGAAVKGEGEFTLVVCTSKVLRAGTVNKCIFSESVSSDGLHEYSAAEFLNLLSQ